MDPPSESPENPPAPPIGGHVDPRFQAVEAAFRENFASRDEIGGAVSVYTEGEPVVDLWGGFQDPERTRPWERDTLVNAYSVGKGVTAMLILSLVERGELDLDAPVARVWPEFAATGKEKVTLRMLLSHRGGLPAVRPPIEMATLYDWKAMSDALARETPFWEPDTAHGYHVNTFGFLVGEPAVRSLGRRFDEILRTRLTGPLGADFHIGLPQSEHARVAQLVGPEPTAGADDAQSLPPPPGGNKVELDAAQIEMLQKTYFNPPGLSGFGVVNDAAWREAMIPSTNCHTTARAVAGLYESFLNRDVAQGGLVGAGLRAEARQIHSDGIDRILGKPSRFGLGFQLAQESRPIGRSPGSFGHYGYGGTLGFADPDAGVAFSYVMNRPGQRWMTPRTNALVDAVYESLGARA